VPACPGAPRGRRVSGEAREAPAVRLALAVIAGSLTATSLYAVLRLVQALLLAEPNPALVIYSPHAGFFWRAWTAAYVGGMVAFVAWFAAGRDAPKTARVILAATTPAAALIVAQGLLVP
jgi:hypothetical protein